VVETQQKQGAVSLPISWCSAQIVEVSLVNPTIDKSAFSDDLEISFVPMSAVQAGTGAIDVTESRKFADVKKGYTPFREGDVLFAKITPCMENGKMAVVPALRNGLGFGSTEFHVLRAQPGFSSAYLYYYVSSESFRREAEHNMSGAVGQRRVTTPYLSACKLPIPPTNEQHSIVGKIEELFSELDKGIESLKTAQAQLKVYRQALLKHAFEGKLTAQWRADNPNKLETADALLKRIYQERAECYEQQLADWKAAGKKGSKPNAPKPRPPLTGEELAELPNLPNGWVWSRVANVCHVVRGGSPRPAGDPKFYGGNIPFLKVADITNTDTPYLSSFTFTITEAGLSKTRQIAPNTLLLSNSGATLGVPKICLISATMNDGVAAFLGLLPESLLYHYYFWQSKTAFLRNIDQGAAQPNLNTDLIKDTFIPLCSLSEQGAVTQQLDAKLSEVDQLDQTITNALQQAEALRQSILKKAFSGQLVPQDPIDEPASALLARIRAERESSAQRPAAAGRRTRKAMA
jgi:type I restriction enzyme S subunit